MATSYSDISYQYAMDRANNPGLHSYIPHQPTQGVETTSIMPHSHMWVTTIYNMTIIFHLLITGVKTMCLIPHTNMWTAIQTHIMVRRLFICTRDKAHGIFNLCVVRYISLKADDVVIKKTSWSMSQLKRFLIIGTFPVHMYQT